jgi:hypothetical protein
VLHDDRALEGANLQLVRLAQRRDAIEVLLVEAADLLEREPELVGVQVAARRAAIDVDGRVEGALEALAVELLNLSKLDRKSVV